MTLFEDNETHMEKEFLKKKRYISIFHNPVTAWFILITSLVLTVGAYFLSASFVQQRVEDRFSFRAIEIKSAIKDRLRIYEQALWGGVGFMNASNSQVSRQEWAKYVESLKINQHWPGIQGIGFSIPVQPEEKQTHIEKIRFEGFPEYLIRPEGTRDLYSAIIYLEPFDWRNQRAFGYDMWSNKMRRRAMTYARDEGVAATSGIITLVQETKEDIQRGFLMYLPVYQTKTIPKTLQEKREQFEGWVYAPFRAGDLMRGIAGTEDLNIEFEIFDGETMSQEALLFDSNSELHLNQSQHNPDFQKTVEITLQGRPWTLYFSTRDTFTENSEMNQPRLVALAGGFVDLLLFYVIYSLYFINRRAETIAKEMTQESRDANEELIMINANLKKTTVSRNYMDSILRSMTGTLIVISSDTTIQTMNQATLNLLGYEESELVEKPIKVVITDGDQKLNLFSGTGLKKLIEKDSVQGIEMTYTAKEGRKIPMLFSGSVMKDEEGTFKGIVCVAQDITERKNAEEELKKHRNHLGELVNERTVELEKEITVRKQTEKALKESKEELVKAQEIAHIGNWHFNFAKNQVIWSEELYKMYGFDPAFPPPLLNESNTLFTTESWELLSTSIAKTEETGIPYEIELKFTRKDGINGWMWARGEAVFDKDGKIVGLRGAAQDITDRKQAEEALQESKEEYRGILTNLNAGIVVHAPDTSVVFCNPQACYTIGLTEGQLMGKEATDHQWKFLRADGSSMPLDDYPVNWIISNNKALNNLVLGVKQPKTNDIRWVLVNGFPVFDTDGEIQQVIINFTDITERKKIEREKQQSEEKFRSLAENNQDQIMRYDDQCRHLYQNIAAYRFSGFTEDELIGRTHRELGIDEKFCTLWEEKITSVFKTGQPASTIFQWESTEGLVFLDLQLFPEFDSLGNVKTVLGVSRDITEIKQAEIQIKNSENKFRMIFENASVGVAQINTQTGQFVNLNQKYCDLIGYERSEMTETTFMEITHPDDLEVHLINMEKLKAGEIREFSMEKRYFHKNGEIVWVNLTVSPMWILGDPPFFHIAIVESITERKQMEDALHEAHNEMESKVEQRTEELNETNSALKILLRKSEEDKIELEEKVLSNMKELVFPFLNHLKNGPINDKQQSILSTIESNLNNVISPFSRRLSSKFSNLTPREIQIASFIKEGKTSKEIGLAIGANTNTVEFHRTNLRKKLGIINEKKNLRNHLLSLR